MDRRTLLAVVISVVIIVAGMVITPILFPPKPAPTASSPANGSPSASEPAAASPGAAASASSQPGSAPAPSAGAATGAAQNAGTLSRSCLSWESRSALSRSVLRPELTSVAESITVKLTECRRPLPSAGLHFLRHRSRRRRLCHWEFLPC